MSNADLRPASTSRWFRALTRLFPKRDQEGRVAEMLDALEVNAGTSTGRETLSLIWAACVAWRRYSFSRDAVHQAVFAGALIWFGLLIGIGPIVRLNGAIYQDGLLRAPGYSTNAALHATAALCLIASLVLLASHRRCVSGFATWFLFPAALVAAAATNRVVEFQLLRSLVYEARWLGLAFGLAVVLRPTSAWRWPAMAALGPSALLTLIPPLHQYQLNLGSNYARLLQISWFDGYLGKNNLIDLIWVFAILFALVAPFFFPAAAAFFAVPVFGIMVAPTASVEPTAMLATIFTMASYMSLVALWNYRRPKLHIAIDRHQQRGRRLNMSLEFTNNTNRW